MLLTVFEGLILYQLITHVYQYVVYVHREPDLVLLMAFAYGAVSLLTIAQCAHGLHFARNHTERTFENAHGLRRSLRLASWLRLFVNAAIYLFLHFHRFAYERAHGHLEAQTKHAMHFVEHVLIGHAAAMIVYAGLCYLLVKREAKQARVLDQVAAKIN